MNVQEYQERMAVLMKENTAIGEENKKLIAEYEKLQEWLDNNSPKEMGFWQLFRYGITLRFWFDPLAKEIEEKQKKLYERQNAVFAGLTLLQSGETPTLH